ncbi:hypothetical protein [Beijerinckia sp. L45]|uniref:hypothetical protein n=1 Tax=Beijerinckia sp. L45 TaxID=1641855 RepID=UPI001FF05F8F|nr:hypothetical protein [Beijerinckia sp. L45]
MAEDTRLEIAVYGGSALILVSNFRYATEDVDIEEIGTLWPDWFRKVTMAIASDNGWSETWMNDAVTVHLSPRASRAADHIEFGTFPSDSDGRGLAVIVPTTEYMLALKLKARRIIEPLKGRQEADDIYSLIQVLKIASADQAIATMAKFFPASAAGAEKQRFLLKNLYPSDEALSNDAPTYGR